MGVVNSFSTIPVIKTDFKRLLRCNRVLKKKRWYMIQDFGNLGGWTDFDPILAREGIEEVCGCNSSHCESVPGIADPECHRLCVYTQCHLLSCLAFYSILGWLGLHLSLSHMAFFFPRRRMYALLWAPFQKKSSWATLEVFVAHTQIMFTFCHQ